MKYSPAMAPGRMLKISMVSVNADPLAPVGCSAAGAQNLHVDELSAALVRAGHDVTVFTRRAHAGGPDRVRARAGYSVDYLEARRRLSRMPTSSLTWEPLPAFCALSGVPTDPMWCTRTSGCPVWQRNSRPDRSASPYFRHSIPWDLRRTATSEQPTTAPRSGLTWNR